VSDPHGGVGGVDALAARARRAEHVDPQVGRVDGDVDRVASGITRTPAADVWMRPWDSVTGTRCTRCTPPSYFSRDQAPSPPRAPLIATVTSLSPPRPVIVESMISVFQCWRSA